MIPPEVWPRLRRIDPLLALAIAALLAIGVCFIYSAGYQRGSSQWLYQIAWIGLGLGVFLGATLFDYRRLNDVAPLLYGLAMILLLLLFVAGKEVHGSSRWFDLRVFHLQPSELAKPALVVMLAAYLGDPVRNLRRSRTILVAMALTLLMFLTIAAQPDLGTGLVLLPIAVSMLVVAGMPWRVLVLFIVLGLLSLPIGWLFLEPHQKMRIRVFLDPSLDPLSGGWNKLQSEMAVASGGLSGKGFLQGTQNILGFLPRTVAPTDFIYSVISEELGFIGSAGVVSLFGMVFISITRTALRTQDPFGRLVSVGILTLLFSHVTVNVAMTVGLLPITGLPLPLVSYGGSFMLSTLLALGLVQSVHVRRP